MTETEPELATMDKLYRLLCEQPWTARRRMLDWLHDRIEDDRMEMREQERKQQ